MLSTNAVAIHLTLTAIAIRLVVALKKVLTLTFFSMSMWLEKMELHVRSYTEGLISKLSAISAADEITPDIRNVFGGLVTMRLVISFIQRKRDTGLMIFAFGICLFALLHLYLAVFFGFAYYMIARVNQLPLSLAESLVTAVFVPLAYADLPRNNWLKGLAGVQFFVLVILGTGELFAYFQRKLDRLYNTALLLNARFEEKDTKARLEELARRGCPDFR